MPTRLQLAFQGGGAKLCALLAAGEVLQRAHEDGEIEITRIAGTSAGAIVAAMIAAKVPISELRSSLQGELGERFSNYYGSVPSVSGTLWSLSRGKALRDTKLLSDWLNERLASKGMRKIEDIEKAGGIKVEIPATDLGSRTSVLPDKRINVVQAILDSCAIPIYFRLWNSAGATIVDGGISENLPVDRLIREQETFGPVLAIAFSPPPATQLRNLVQFLYSLLDAAISVAEDRARQSLPASSVIHLEPRFSTFDFGRAIREGLGDFYDLMKSHTKEGVRNFLAARSEEHKRLQRNPWSESNPTARYLMNQVASLYERVEQGRPLKYHSVRFSVFANSLRAGNDPQRAVGDVAEFVMVMSATDQPVSSIAIGLSEPDPLSTFRTDTAICRVSGPNGDPWKIITLPMSANSTPNDRDLCIFFDPPLPANSGPYTIHFQEYGTDLFGPLVKTGRDEIEYFPRRAFGNIGKIELIIYAPAEFKVMATPRGRAARQRQLREDECADSGRYLGLKGLGWVAEDIDTGQPGEPRWGLDLTTGF